MSGSTRVERRSERVRLVLETPCISFLPNPDGSSPERDYHTRARQRFEAEMERLWPGLADEVERAAAGAGVELVGLDEEVDWQRRVYLHGYGEGHVELVAKEPLDDAQRERMKAALAASYEARQPRPEAQPEPARSWWAFWR